MTLELYGKTVSSRLLLGTAPVAELCQRVGTGKATHLLYHAVQIVNVAKRHYVPAGHGIGRLLGRDGIPAPLAILAVDPVRHLRHGRAIGQDGHSRRAGSRQR